MCVIYSFVILVFISFTSRFFVSRSVNEVAISKIVLRVVQDNDVQQFPILS